MIVKVKCRGKNICNFGDIERKQNQYQILFFSGPIKRTEVMLPKMIDILAPGNKRCFKEHLLFPFWS